MPNTAAQSPAQSSRSHPPYGLAACALALTAALAGCGGGDKDSGTPPPSPPPGQKLDVSFTLPKPLENVYDVHAPVYLEVRVDVNANPADNNTPVTFTAPTASLAPVQAMTVGGKATTTLHASQIGPLQVEAKTTVFHQSANTNHTLYIRPKREPLQILVPAYFAAGKDSPWDTLIASYKSYPDVKINAILNPTNGVFTEADKDFVTAMEELQKNGGKVFGYVATKYGDGARSVADITNNVDSYLTYYPKIDGIFLDEMANGTNRIKFYREVYDSIKRKSANLYVIGNPGTYPDPAYAGVADALVTFEGKELTYRNIDPQPSNTWVYNRANTAQAMLVHNASTCLAMQDAIKRADLARTNTGMVYVTNELYEYTTNTGNPWATLPQYWNTLLGTVDAINRGWPLPNC